MRLRDVTATRAQELLEEALALQERRDSGNDMLTERTEENALLGVQVGQSTCCSLHKAFRNTYVITDIHASFVGLCPTYMPRTQVGSFNPEFEGSCTSCVP